MDYLAAIIPARLEDKLLPQKNIFPFGDSNLLIHKIRQLKKVKQISQIVVSSENDYILDLAQSESVVALKRPDEYSKIGASFGNFVEHIARQISAEHILWACVTSPLVDTANYEEAIRLYIKKLQEGYDSLITVQRIRRFLLDDNGPLNFRLSNKYKDKNELAELYEFTNGIVLAPRLSMVKWKYNWGVLPYKLELDRRTTIDICDRYDYEFAQFLFSNESIKGGSR